MQVRSNIPVINDKFDLYIFLHIIKKSKWVVLFLFVIMAILTAIYLRYTPRLYEASAVIQINNENSSTKLFGVDNLYEEDELAQNVELLSSKQFLIPVLQTLPVKVSYYNKGTFLTEELYKNSPINISYKITNQSIIEKPVYFKYIDDTQFKLSFDENFEKKVVSCKFGEKVDIEGAIVNIELSNPEYCKNTDKKNKLYFVFNNPISTYKNQIEGLEVRIKNPDAKTIEIKYTGKNALKTAEIVNTIASGYIKYEIDKKKESSSSILSFIDEQTRVIYRDLDKTERQIHSFKQENNIKDFKTNAFQPANVFMGKIKDFDDQILKAEMEISSLKQINTKLSQEDDISIFELIALTSGISSQNIVEILLQELQELLSKKDELLNRVTNQNHQMQMINQQIDNKKKNLVEFITKTIDRLYIQKRNYKQKIKEYDRKLLKESDYDEIEYSSLKRYYSVQDKFYEKLIEKKAEYLISQAGYVSKNTILEQASVPVSPVTPNVKLIIVLAFILGFFVSLIYLSLKYLFYNELHSVHELELYTDTPILGSVPLIDMKNKYSQLVVNKDINSIVAESFRTIRSNLDFYHLNHKGNLITVSSTVSGEGKTFVAINFAASLAMRNKKVIMIDLDLRKPKVHYSLGVENGNGMSRLLSGHLKLQEVINHTELDNLDYICADKTPPNPSELISSKLFDDVIEELKEVYDYIVVDTSPIGLVSDAIGLFRKADMPIYVLKANYSKRQFLYNLDHLREKNNISHINIIFNGVDFKGKRYGHYGYGYGYGYGVYADKNQKKSWFNKLF